MDPEDLPSSISRLRGPFWVKHVLGPDGPTRDVWLFGSPVFGSPEEITTSVSLLHRLSCLAAAALALRDSEGKPNKPTETSSPDGRIQPGDS
jgi:hypothetical protein